MLDRETFLWGHSNPVFNSKIDTILDLPFKLLLVWEILVFLFIHKLQKTSATTISQSFRSLLSINILQEVYREFQMDSRFKIWKGKKCWREHKKSHGLHMSITKRETSSSLQILLMGFAGVRILSWAVSKEKILVFSWMKYFQICLVKRDNWPPWPRNL